VVEILLDHAGFAQLACYRLREGHVPGRSPCRQQGQRPQKAQDQNTRTTQSHSYHGEPSSNRCH